MKTAKHSILEQALKALVDAAAAGLVAMAAFTGMLFLCAELFAAENSYNSMVYGPAAAVCAGTVSFVLAFYVAVRWQGRRRGMGSAQAV